ncbi:MAG TPA: hypothetical protein VNQ79_10835, partial [Blastocatellia bacterium]|nr:hypothetical protein [Blastocatellia bacterium]
MTLRKQDNQLMRFVSLMLVLLLSQPTTLPLLAQASGGALNATISTVAGGGLAATLPARQAPLMNPSAVVPDPRGRGFYVLDGGTSLSDVPPYGFMVRFANTSAQTVTLGTLSIEAGSIGRIAGGGSAEGDDLPASTVVMDNVPAIAADPGGDVLYVLTPLRNSVRAVNVGTQNVTVAGKTIAPGAITTIATSDTLTGARGLAIHPTTREIYYIGGQAGSNIV